MKPLKIVIRGGNSLSGMVTVSGAKNAALPGLAAALLTDRPCRLRQIPQVEDIHNLLLALQAVGCEHEWGPDGLLLHAGRINEAIVSREIAGATRASILLLGPLTARCGRARIAFPGGCSIGERKIDFHLQGLRQMGARIEIENDAIVARAAGLKAAAYRFPSKSVTGTENLMMAAALADGVSVLENCALEPEIADLARMLTAMGATVEGIGGETLAVHGRPALSGADHRIIPDRIEAGTYLIAGCLPGNRIEVENVEAGHCRALVDVLTEIGCRVNSLPGGLLASGGSGLRPVSVSTAPFPGFPTDLQAQLTTLLTQVEGVSRVVETIFNDRFKHARELNRLGADISVSGDTAVVRGRTALIGAEITTTDLRASAALVLGGLAASGETVIHNAGQLMRGYENLPEKLHKLGAEIKIVAP